MYLEHAALRRPHGVPADAADLPPTMVAAGEGWLEQHHRCLGITPRRWRRVSPAESRDGNNPRGCIHTRKELPNDRTTKFTAPSAEPGRRSRSHRRHVREPTLRVDE